MPRAWILACSYVLVVACGGARPAADGAPPTPPHAPAAEGTMKQRATFEDDVAFLEKFAPVVVLESPGGGRVAVSPTYQGRVMTSAVAKGTASLGFVHRAFIEKRQTGTQFDNYGGEDRFWLGPEGGQYGLYFPPRAPFVFDQWKTPAAFQEGAWPVKSQSATEIVFERPMKVTSYAGTTFELTVTRTVRLLGADAAAARFGAPLPSGAQWVAFETENRVTNTGATPWTKDTGLLSVWILGMYNPSADTHVVVPFDRAGSGPIVNDAYFGKVPRDRLRVDEPNGVVVFSADGTYRSKIGLGPTRAKPTLGSYSPSARLLTVVAFDKPAGATEYVNSMWEVQKQPYAGDVVNSYNDGPPAPGKPALGGFYELETSSPAAALAPGASIVHTHRTLHVVADEPALDGLAKAAFGVPLARAR